MIEFLKILFRKVNFKTGNKQLNTFNKIIYSIIVISAIVLIGFVLWIVIKHFPDFIESAKYNLNETKLNFNYNK